MRGTEAHHTDALAELVCSNSFRSDDWENNAVGLLHEEMRRAGSLIMRTADAHKLPAGGALAVDRDGFSDAVTAGAGGASAHPIAREEVAGLPPAEWGAAIIATGPLTSARAGGSHRGADRRRTAGFLRRHRADRAQEVDRFRHRLDAVALRQEGRAAAADYINCPMDRGAVRGVHRRAAGGREDRFQGMGEIDALFRRLPADRGDGVARARDACASGR